MPKIGPIKRRELIFYLRKLGFSGPYSGGRHQFMLKDSLRLRMPNPHLGDIGPNLLTQILREAAIDKTIWENL